MLYYVLYLITRYCLTLSLSFSLYSLDQVLAGGLVAQIVGKGHLALLVPSAHYVTTREEEADGETLGVVLLQHPLHLLLLVHPLLLPDQTVEGLVEHIKVFLLDGFLVGLVKLRVDAGHEEVGDVAACSPGVGHLPVYNLDACPSVRLDFEHQVVEVEVSLLQAVDGAPAVLILADAPGHNLLQLLGRVECLPEPLN